MNGHCSPYLSPLHPTPGEGEITTIIYKLENADQWQANYVLDIQTETAQADCYARLFHTVVKMHKNIPNILASTTGAFNTNQTENIASLL